MKNILFVAIFWAGWSQAAIITVNKTTDNLNNNDGGCDIREAVTAANTNQTVDGCLAGNDIDIILLDVNGPIQLSSQIEVTSSMAIRAPFGFTEPVHIIAANYHRVFEVFPIQGNNHVFEFVGLLLTDGDAKDAPGGAIYIHNNQINGLISEIFISQCSFRHNQALHGGSLAIINTQTSSKVTIRDSQFDYNQATDNGGGLYIDNGSANQLTLLNNTFNHNSAVGNGGASMIADSGISDFTLSNNQFNHNISLESGGGLAIFATSAVQRYIMNRNAFIGNNASDNGGALYAALDAQVWLYNSVMSNNLADRGGAISTVSAWLYLYHSTLAHNYANNGANIYGYSGTIGSMGASVLAYPQGAANCGGTASSLNSGRTIIDDASCPFNFSSDLREDPLLAGLSFNNNGFPALQPTSDSSAIDRVPVSACVFYGGDSLDSDQQGNQRPMDGDGDNTATCDIGAIEVPLNHDLIWSDTFGG